jgi:hypothetical protein
MSAREQRLRQKREELLAAAKRRTLISLWSGAWIAVSLSEALDLTTASGRALAGMLAVFAEFWKPNPGLSPERRDRSGTRLSQMNLRLFA